MANRQLQSPGSLHADARLQTALARIEAEKGWYAELGRRPALNMALNNWNRSQANDAAQMDNMSRLGNGRNPNSVAYRNGGHFASGNAGPSTEYSYGMLQFVFWVGLIYVVWQSLGKVHLQGTVIGIASGLWNMVMTFVPAVWQILNLFASVLTQIIQHVMGH